MVDSDDTVSLLQLSWLLLTSAAAFSSRSGSKIISILAGVAAGCRGVGSGAGSAGALAMGSGDGSPGASASDTATTVAAGEEADSVEESSPAAEAEES